MTLITFIPMIVFIAAGFLGFCGLVMLKRGEPALVLLAHTRASLVQVFAGRYIAMAFMLLGLTAFNEYRALAIILVVGGLMGFLDFYYVGKAGGQVWPHALAGILCFVLALGAYTIAHA